MLSKQVAIGCIVGLLCGLVPLFHAAASGENGIIKSGPYYVRKNHKAWKHRGRIAGLAGAGSEFRITITELSGKVVTTAEKGESKDERRAFEIWIEPGIYRLHISAPGFKIASFERLKIRAGYDVRIDLEFTGEDGSDVAGDYPTDLMEMVTPRYLRKKHKAWKDRGRIVGVVRSAAESRVTVMNKRGRVLSVAEMEKVGDGRSVYEFWLGPGKYMLRVGAEGFWPIVLDDLKVKAGNDLRIDFEIEAGRH